MAQNTVVEEATLEQAQQLGLLEEEYDKKITGTRVQSSMGESVDRT